MWSGEDLLVLLITLADLSPEHSQRVSSFHIAVACGAGVAVRVPLKRISLARGKKQVLLHPMLRGIEIVVAALRSIELFMRTPLHDLSLLHHQNLISAPDGRKPVRDYKRGPALHEIRKAMLDHLFRFGVEA